MSLAERLYVGRVEPGATIFERDDVVVMQVRTCVAHRANIALPYLPRPVWIVGVKIVAGAERFNEASPVDIVAAVRCSAASDVVLLALFISALEAGARTG